MELADVNYSGNIAIDGEDISEILKGMQNSHGPVFSMHNNHITSIRKGDWKLFVRKPRHKRLPADWVDPRGPDGTTIIAPIIGQAGPADYLGLVPEKPINDIQLSNLKIDPTESNDLAQEKPEIVEQLLTECKIFEASCEVIN